jgi:hypothetical protein
LKGAKNFNQFRPEGCSIYEDNPQILPRRTGTPIDRAASSTQFALA